MLPKKPSVLIVDDVAKNIQVVANILQSEGYQMAFALNGKAALESIGTKLFDLILLDVMMPGIDGFEVCRQLKSHQETADVPIIFLTAKADTESVAKGFELGAVDYVTKPFKAVELLARVRTHLKLRYSEQQLQELNANKDKFFSIISHDLRSPFSALLGYIQLTLEDFESCSKDEILENLEKVKSCAESAAKLLENLLAWSRFHRGALAYQPEWFDLSALASTTVLLSKQSANLKNISFINNIDEDTLVYADRQMIDTVLRNLISNAVKFTQAGGTITLATTMENGLVEVAVLDTGVGIDEATQAKLFRIEVHHNTTGTAGEQGTGLGLILCQDLVEKNGGHIRVKSQPTQGAGFYFTLPASKPT